MKKISALLLAAGMVVAASAPANAVDVKVDARYRFSFMTGQAGFNGENQESFQQRLRLGLTMAASENLSGYVQFQIMGEEFGSHKLTSNAGHTEDLKTRQAYIDWTVPATAIKVRMGRQTLGLPADAFGENAVMASGLGSRDGIVVTAPVTDWLGLTALWTRANHDGDTDLDKNSTDDIYAAVANLKFKGVSASVYAAYATLDESSAPGNLKYSGATLPTYEGSAYWVGFTSALTMFDPFTLKLSAAYGEASADHTSEVNNGWNVQAKASYKLGFGTPVLGAWYFSGDEDKFGDGTMPHNQGAFTPTRTYHDGALGLVGGTGYDFMLGGSWGVQAGIEGVSFLEGLTHDFLVTYIEGTNDKNAEGVVRSDRYLTEDDSFVEFDFITTYKIYKNLAAHLELSYLINDFDGDNGTTVLTEDDWRAELTFEYKF